MATNDDDSDDSNDDIGCWKDCKKSVVRCLAWFNKKFDIVHICHEICKTSLFLMFWMICYAMFGDVVGPTSHFFKLLVLFSSAEVLGKMVEYMKIPSVIGMLTMGVILKNFGYVQLTRSTYGLVVFLRYISLISILLSAAFTLDPRVVKERPVLIISLAVFPTAVEIATLCVFSYFVLPPTLLWSLLLGFIVSAASPSIVIPCLITLDEKGYGKTNGINTLITSASILNVIVTVTLYGLVYGMLTAKPSEALKTLTRGPVEVLIAVVYGIGVGYIAQYIPHDDDVSDQDCLNETAANHLLTVFVCFMMTRKWYVSTLRTGMVLFGSILSLSGSYAVGYPGAGMLGCFVSAFVANLRWRRLGWSRHNPVRDNFKILWRIFTPICYSLFGVEIDFKSFPVNQVLYGILGTLLCTMSHFLARLTVTSFFKFKFGERVFIGLSWIPKASVQVVLAPLPLTFARLKGPIEIHYSESIMWVICVSIFLTVPLGIILMLSLGPKLLTKDDVTPDNSQSNMNHITLADYDPRRHKRRLSLVHRPSQNDHL